MNDVLTELLASPLPQGAWPFTLTTAKGEGGDDVDAWRRCYGGALYAGPLETVFNSKNPLWAGKQGPAGISHAFGTFQFQPGTYEEAAARTHLTTVVPQSQLANFWNHAQFVYKHLAGKELLTALEAGEWQDACNVLSTTWTSFTSSLLAKRYACSVRMIAAVIVPPPAQPVPSVDPELAAIADLLRDLTPLSPDARKRVLAYVEARLNA